MSLTENYDYDIYGNPINPYFNSNYVPPVPPPPAPPEDRFSGMTADEYAEYLKNLSALSADRQEEHRWSLDWDVPDTSQIKEAPKIEWTDPKVPEFYQDLGDGKAVYLGTGEKIARGGENTIVTNLMTSGLQDLAEARIAGDIARRFDFGDPYPSSGYTGPGPFGISPKDMDIDILGLYDEQYGAKGGGVSAAQMNMFANMETAAIESYNSILGYFDELSNDLEVDFKESLNRRTKIYNSAKNKRNAAYEEALAEPEKRQEVAIDTLASIGITATSDDFDAVTGETIDTLKAQQLSGGDMLNTISYLTDMAYDFAENEAELSIAAGLEAVEQSHIAEMAAIQQARDSFIISSAVAAQAQSESNAKQRAQIEGLIGLNDGLIPEQELWNLIQLGQGDPSLAFSYLEQLGQPSAPTYAVDGPAGGQYIFDNPSDAFGAEMDIIEFLANQNTTPQQAVVPGMQGPDGEPFVVDVETIQDFLNYKELEQRYG